MMKIFIIIIIIGFILPFLLLDEDFVHFIVLVFPNLKDILDIAMLPIIILFITMFICLIGGPILMTILNVKERKSVRANLPDIDNLPLEEVERLKCILERGAVDEYNRQELNNKDSVYRKLKERYEYLMEEETTRKEDARLNNLKNWRETLKCNDPFNSSSWISPRSYFGQ